MAKKKKSKTASADAEPGSQPNGSNVSSVKPAQANPAPAPAPPTLVICRNKHWRYISSYHGPWLNLPPEVLETLAHSNYYSLKPQPIDPAVFFDLVRIRRLIDDATSLAVRAANGTTAFSLNTSLNSAHGYLNGADADILGISHSRGGGANAKLSSERKFRMREHATSKLSHAYRLDEIAASVATMQSASALEDVAKHVLQRNEHDPQAMYVHFFHEKIPSRAMAECTSLKPLSDIINQRPTEAAAYRTRAVTRIFKEEFHAAARDLTEGLATQRLYHGHRSDQLDLILAKDAAKLSQAKLDERDYPSSMEPQLLFHRANVYLTMACQNIAPALNRFDLAPSNEHIPGVQELPPLESLHQKEEARDRMEARKLVRTYAKRALRDYTAFLSRFDYTPGLSAEFTEAFLDKVASMTNPQSTGSRSQRLLDVDAHSQHGLSEALFKYERRRNNNPNDQFPQIPKPAVHKLSDLFNAVPPQGLPPYPPDAQTAEARQHPVFSLPDFSEAVTYHPLLTDVLHSLLLCHCLVQTSVKEHQRHAYMAARISRVCDGYPIFLAARSPSRADWVEVLRKTKNWVGLDQTWEHLCTPSPNKDRQRRGSMLHKDGTNGKKANGHSVTKKNDNREKLDEIKRNAIREALADERVVDEDTFRQSVRAREARAIAAEDEEMRKEYNNISPTRSTDTNANTKSTSGASTAKDPTAIKTNGANSKPNQDTPLKEKDYSISTERAEMITRWIHEAPPPGGDGSSSGTSRRKPAAKRNQNPQVRALRKQASDMSAASQVSNVSGGSNATTTATGLEQSVESLDMVD
ncbi:hypothetical protein LTR24_006169 [Lithohypha guttulata]|uniref:Uncharacterized protein n=1 Tax=Lithohypha guttulata TaxID=1690604 RepID=A0ABR0K6L6_9EURO|nr:hypothetical protein LTR24_006169 [Lithohypha guttulata]